MKKWLTLFVFVLALFVLVISVFLFYSKQQVANPAQTSNKSLLTELLGRKTEVSLSLSPAVTTIQSGKSLSVEIKVKAADLIITAVSTRLTLKYKGQLPLQPKSQKLTVNQELIKAGWSYLLNQVKVDSQDKILTLDLLMANLEPEGYKLNQEISLGQLEFIAQPGSSSADFEFDGNLTKLKDKDGAPLRLKLEEAHYTIY